MPGRAGKTSQFQTSQYRKDRWNQKPQICIASPFASIQKHFCSVYLAGWWWSLSVVLHCWLPLHSMIDSKLLEEQYYHGLLPREGEKGFTKERHLSSTFFRYQGHAAFKRGLSCPNNRTCSRTAESLCPVSDGAAGIGRSRRKLFDYSFFSLSLDPALRHTTHRRKILDRTMVLWFNQRHDSPSFN